MTEQITALNRLIGIGTEILEDTQLDPDAFRTLLKGFTPRRLDDWECGVTAHAINFIGTAALLRGGMPIELKDKDDDCPFCSVSHIYWQIAWDYVDAAVAKADRISNLLVPSQ